MSNFTLTTGMLVHVALCFYAVGFMIRDELLLRSLVLVGTVFYLLYYYYYPETPLWDAIFASSVIGAVNITLILIIIRERTLFSMNSEEAGLFHAFSTLTPGQFRRMMKIANWRTAAAPTTLTREHERPVSLYYIVSGEMDAQKGDRHFKLDPEKFIGEIAFLMQTEASATVIAEPGTVYIEWNANDLKRLVLKSQSFENALIALFNSDLAKKVSVAVGR